MIKEYLTHHQKIGKLYNSYIINSDNAELALLSVKEFLQNLLKIENVDYSHDLIIIQKEGGTVKNIPTDKIREIGKFLYKTSMMSGKKIAIVFGAEQMNLNASNALLKILEDTPANSYLFLITENIAGILPTIRSRCAKINHHYFSLENPANDNDLYLKALNRNSPLSEKLSFIKSFASKDRDAWANFSLFAENLISKFCKQAARLEISLSDEEAEIFAQLKSHSANSLQNKYEYICKSNRDITQFDLELQSSAILLIEQFNS
jgi:DNA polymerase-3 subunit delta'